MYDTKYIVNDHSSLNSLLLSTSSPTVDSYLLKFLERNTIYFGKNSHYH